MSRLKQLDWGESKFSILPMGPGLCLDLGCGDGRTRVIVEVHGYTWIGVDIAPHKKLSALCDAHRLPFRDEAFSAVVAMAVWEHFSNPEQALREVQRTLKDDGYLFGSAAFLEPFHGSYFHFSHLGLQTILQTNGFSIEHLSVGWHAVEAIANTLYGQPFRRLFRVLALLTMRLRRVFIKVLLWWFQASGNEGQYQRKKAFLETDELRFAGSLVFLAHKKGNGRADENLRDQ